jgi:hypothetical protein
LGFRIEFRGSDNLRWPFDRRKSSACRGKYNPGYILGGRRIPNAGLFLKELNETKTPPFAGIVLCLLFSCLIPAKSYRPKREGNTLIMPKYFFAELFMLEL